AFAEIEQKVEKLRAEGVLIAQPIALSVAFGSSFAALRSVHDELNNLRSITERLPRVGQPPPHPILTEDSQPAMDWFCVQMGVHGGLVAAISLALLMWILPPGAGAIPLMVWVQAINGWGYLRVGGTGDCRGFKNAVLRCLVFAGCPL